MNSESSNQLYALAPSVKNAIADNLFYNQQSSISEVDYSAYLRSREATEDKRADLPPAQTWRIRKEESLTVLKNTDDIGVLMVWLGDKLANMRAIYRDFKVEGEAMWQRFNQKDAKEHFIPRFRLQNL